MTTEIVEHQNKVPEVAKPSPMEMMTAALAQGADVNQLEKMMELQERWEANEAKKAYVKAMAAFKANPPKIIKDKKVQYGNTKYSHASLGNASDLISTGLGEHGLSASWTQDQLEKGEIKVTCFITHEMGHSESTSLISPADKSGAKNSIQAIGSTISYLQRYTLLAITGLAAQDQDDDGIKAAPPKTISESQASQVVDMMAASGVDVADYLEYLGVAEIADLQENRFGPVMAELKRIQEKNNAD